MSKFKIKELYLSWVVEVQFFFNVMVISELSDQVMMSLQELGVWVDGENLSFQEMGMIVGYIVSSQYLFGMDEGDVDMLLFDMVLSGNLEGLRDLFGWMRVVGGDERQQQQQNMVMMEWVIRIFFVSINEGLLEVLYVLLEMGLVDIQSEDDINERNCLYQVVIYGNGFVLEYGFVKGVVVDWMDVYGWVLLYYVSIYGRLDMLDKLFVGVLEMINLIDYDNYMLLIYVIVYGYLECVGRLLEREVRLDLVLDMDYVLLNLVCEYGFLVVVELLLKYGVRILVDVEGFYFQYLVVRLGQMFELLLLFQNYGVDLDQIDKLYGWILLVYVVSEGNVFCFQVLLNVGVDLNILDEKDFLVMYYVVWEGYLECMKFFMLFSKDKMFSLLVW